jgi:succinylarginine dihydrolase
MQTIVWQNEQIKIQNSLSIYLSNAQELAAEYDSLFRIISQQCEDKHYDIHEQEFKDMNNRLPAVQVCL